jgi:hypothetical protein
VDLPLGAVKGAVQDRNTAFPEDLLSTLVSSLRAGRHIILLAANPHTGLALAELAADVAADRGLCYGTLTFAPDLARLLSPADVLADELRDDFWLMLEQLIPSQSAEWMSTSPRRAQRESGGRLS